MHRLRIIVFLVLALGTGLLNSPAGVFLSSYSFTAENLPYIWTDDPLPEPYRLRAKIGGSYHATNLFNNDWSQLESVPGPGTFTVELYWVLYEETDWSSVIEVGPFNTLTIVIQSANQPPQANWVSAAASSPGQSTTLTGNASDPNGNLQWLHFFTNDPGWSGYVHAGSAYVGSTANTTSSVNWQVPPGYVPGSYQAHLRASDTNGVYDWNGGASAGFSIRYAQPTVFSQNATVALGATFAPSYFGGAGTGPWQFVIANKTNWGGSQPGTLLPPSNTPSLTWTADQIGPFTFYVIKQGDSSYFGSNIAGPYTVTVQGSPPSIASQPQPLTVTTGQAATFSVVAGGAGPFSYQWRKNGTNIGGANSATYTIAAAQPADAGGYSVVVGNGGGAVTSNTANLAVTVVAPSISTQPVSQTVSAGQNATFSVGAGGSAPLSYQWRKNGANIPGASTSSYAISGAQPADAAGYSVVVSNGAGSAASSTATLTVNLVAPTVATHPVSQTANTGQAVTFSVVAAGSAPFTYQWRKNGSPIAAATNRQFSIPSAQTSDAANTPGYSVVVTNSVGSISSNPATLTVTTTQAIRLALQYWQPNDWPNYEIGGSYMDVWVYYTWVVDEYDEYGTPTSGHDEWDPHWDSQWVPEFAPDGQFGSRWDTTVGSFGNPLSTDTSAFNPAVTNRGYLRNTYPQYTTLTFRAWVLAPSNNCNNFTVSVYYPTNGLMVWTNLPSGGNFEWPAYLWQSGVYRIDLAYSGATATSQPGGTVSYYVAVGVGTPPAIIVHPGPASQTVSAGTSVSYTVTATDATTYQWQKDGAPVPGANSAGLALTNVQPSAAGTYRVLVGNDAGTTLSYPAVLAVTNDPLADSDADGLPNGIEQLLATNPSATGTTDPANTTLQLKIHKP